MSIKKTKIHLRSNRLILKFKLSYKTLRVKTCRTRPPIQLTIHNIILRQLNRETLMTIPIVTKKNLKKKVSSQILTMNSYILKRNLFISTELYSGRMLLSSGDKNGQMHANYFLQ